MSTAESCKKSYVSVKNEIWYNTVYCIHTLIGYSEIDYSTSCLWDLDCHINYIDAPEYKELSDFGNTIQEIALYHYKKIILQRPQGPYKMLGWSAGGIIGLEMAKLLQNDGYDVELLMVDSQNPDMIRNLSIYEHAKEIKNLGELLKVIFRIYCKFDPQNLILPSINQFAEYDNKAAQAEALFDFLDESIFGNDKVKNIISTCKLVYLASLKYDISDLSGYPPVTILQAEETADLGWKIDKTKDFIHIIKNTGHFNIMKSHEFKDFFLKWVNS